MGSNDQFCMYVKILNTLESQMRNICELALCYTSEEYKGQ